MLLGASTVASFLLFAISQRHMLWEALIISILYIASGLLLLKGKLIAHYIAASLLAVSLLFKINALITIYTTDLNIRVDLIIQISSAHIAMILFFCISLLLIVRDIIKIRTNAGYELIVNKYNEPELWLYPWFIALICLYLVRYDLETSYFAYLLSPIVLLITHIILKKNSRITFDGIKNSYIISLICWFVPYVFVILFSGYILAQIVQGLASQGAGN